MCKLWRGIIILAPSFSLPSHNIGGGDRLHSAGGRAPVRRQLDIGHHRNIMFIQMIYTIKQSSKTSFKHRRLQCKNCVETEWLKGGRLGGTRAGLCCTSIPVTKMSRSAYFIHLRASLLWFSCPQQQYHPSRNDSYEQWKVNNEHEHLGWGRGAPEQ